jgi:hypothetical protein
MASTALILRFEKQRNAIILSADLDKGAIL